MEKSDFHRLLERYVKGEVTDHEKTKIEAWLNVLQTEKITDANLSREEEDKLFHEITANLNNVEAIVKFRPASWKKSQRNRWALGIAAGLVLITVASISIFMNSTSLSGLDIVASGDTEKIILNDGSIAWLKKGSRLTYFEKPAENLRYGELEGEGLFEIAKDSLRPFVLECGEASVRVVGTSFRLRSSSSAIELWVLTGHVKVSSTLVPEIIDVRANEKISLSQQTSHRPSLIDSKEKESVVAGTEYNMSFDDATLSEVLGRLSRKFNVLVSVESNTINQCRITADFTDHSLESTLLMISEITDIRYKLNGNQVIIEGDGCKSP